MSIRRSTQRILSMALAAAALVSTGTLTGCAGFWQPVNNNSSTNNNTGTGDFVYVGKNNSTTLAGYQIGTGGTLTAIGSGLTIAAAPTALAISPNNNFLYAGTASAIYAYSISSTGTLTVLNSGAALASGFSIAAMDISPDGNWLVVITSTPVLGTAGFLYQISPTTGLIVGTGGKQLTAPATGIGQAVQFAPTEANAGVTTSTIAASFGTAGIYTYTFGTNTMSGGIPTFVAQLPVSFSSASDNGLVWNSLGTEIFFASGGGDTTLYAYPVNSATGAIGSLAGNATTGTNPTALSFDSSGTYIYVTNSGTSPAPAATGSTISGYTVTTNSSTTTFSQLGTSPFSTNGSGPGAIVNAGGYILAVNQTGPPDFLLYTVDTVTPGRLYVTSSENTTLTVSNGTPLGAGVSIAITN